jgi:hypothetical protein
MQAHLRKALRKRLITKSELIELTLKYVEIVKMLTSWMKYLRDSDWDNRG